MKDHKMKDISPNSTYQEMTPAGNIYGSGTSELFKTGDWRTATPKWIADVCKQCLMCYPVCPDSSIPVSDKKRSDFDFDHCKGCGICFKVCPFGAITMQVDGE